MSYRDCFACKQQRKKPKPGLGVLIVFDPRIQMPGTPTISGHRLSARQIAQHAWCEGINETMQYYDLTREEVLLACWWAGHWGPRLLREAYREWSAEAAMHLWSGCINITDPPDKVVRENGGRP